MNLLRMFCGVALLALAACNGETTTTPTPALPLQSYISTSGGYILEYPVGWLLREEAPGQVAILPDEADVTAQPDDLPQLLMRVRVLDADPQGVSLMRAVDAQRERVLAQGGRILLQNDFTFIDGNYGVQRLIEVPGSLGPVQEAVILAEIGGRILEISGRGDLATWNQLAGRVRPAMGIQPTPSQ